MAPRSWLTMIRLPGGKRGQALALAMTVVSAIMVWIVVIGPLISIFAAHQTQLRDNRALLMRMQALSDQIPSLRTRLSHLGPHDRARDSLLSGDRDASAAADLQQHISVLTGANAIAVASEDVARPVSLGPYREIGVHLNFSAHWSDLVAFLTAIQQTHPTLIADDLHIQSQADGGDMVDVALTVSGFRAINAHEAGHDTHETLSDEQTSSDSKDGE